MEPATVSYFGKIWAVSVLALPAWAAALVVEAQPPIRIGASLSLTGIYAAFGQNQGRGYQLCVKHMNERGGVLGRKLEFIVYDDQSQPAAGVRLYEKLIRHEKVDAVFGPYGSPITDAVADVTEKYRMPLVTHAGTTSIFRKGRKFMFMLFPPGEVYFEGLMDLAAKKGLKRVAVINEDTFFPRAVARGAVELAGKKGLVLVFQEAYPKGTTDFSAILRKLGVMKPDVLAAGTYFDDAVAILRQMKELGVGPRMYGVTLAADLPKFYAILGRTAEFVYGPTPWEPELVTLRAGGLIPIARQYPGARDFVDSYRREFPGADFSYNSAAGYAICQILVEAIKRTGSLDGPKMRDAILKLDLNTVFGAFRVDQDGVQIAGKMLTLQWQDGKKVIVWPEELAPGKPRFPTPPWSQRP
ncbi:MAG TPA: amino acid ABC transporter substrate-binding protein [Methylomirabilota bacterium]